MWQDFEAMRSDMTGLGVVEGWAQDDSMSARLCLSPASQHGDAGGLQRSALTCLHASMLHTASFKCQLVIALGISTGVAGAEICQTLPPAVSSLLAPLTPVCVAAS